MKRILIRILISVGILLALVYAADYLTLRYRIPGSRIQFGSVDVRQYYAVRLKSGKTEYMYDDELQTQECVNSLFPHLGDPPCWYARRHPQREIDVK